MNPVISILLPVYNSAPFLKKCIDSILAQTFADFECIIINDGSTDDSEKIILSYNDPRIIYVTNNQNQGLIFTLNKAIDMARGNYFARMDADDICLPKRMEVQKKWLDNHPGTAMVASFSEFIDERENSYGFYRLDRETISAEQIRRKLPFENCITHPSVMGRAEIFKTYKYNAKQKNIEDYDFWLRLAADQKMIEKVPEVLLLYRIHSSSITQTKLRNNNFFFKHFNCKRKYLMQRLQNGKFTAFDFRVLLEMVTDLVRGSVKQIKKTIVSK